MYNVVATENDGGKTGGCQASPHPVWSREFVGPGRREG
jgi:hypothetical protein